MTTIAVKTANDLFGIRPSPMLDKSICRIIALLMVVTVVAARSNRVSPALPVVVSDDLNGYLLSGDGRRPLCHWGLLAAD